MKKVTMLLTNGFDPDVRVYKEALYLISRGYSVTILCWDRDEQSTYKAEEIIDQIHVIRFKIPSVAGSGLKQIPAFFSYIKACKFWLGANATDYFHCNDIDGAIVWFLAKNSKVPMIFDMHEFYEDYGSKSKLSVIAYRMLTKFFIKKSRYSLYENNLYLLDNYKSVYAKLLPLKNYPDSDLVKCIEKVTCNKFRIGYHGAVRGQIKEFTTLFEAVKNMDDIQVDIHGGGPDLNELQELSKKYKNVTVHGPFNGTKELTELYANTDIVFAGYTKNSKSCECDEMVKFFECIVTGTPMILTECYALMAKQVKDGGFGIACDTDDVEAVRDAVLKFKNDTEYTLSCSRREKEQAYKFDWKEAVKILDKAYGNEEVG